MIIRIPSHLNKLAKAQWRKYVPSLKERTDITPQDLHNLESFCVNYAMYRAALEDVEANGLILVFNNDNKGQNPAYKVMMESQKLMLKFGELLGFDPVSRVKHKAPVEDKDDLDGLIE
jgi:P27 family predicted phage terminase small subunit